MSIYISKNFKFQEFACPCCGKMRPIDNHLVFLLQSLREKIDKPIYITSGLRCKKYNKKIYGFYNSAHLIGKAVDIYAKNIDLITLAKKAKNIGFSRTGIYPDNHFIHIDIIRKYRSASWVKRKNKRIIYFKTLEDAINSLRL